MNRPKNREEITRARVRRKVVKKLRAQIGVLVASESAPNFSSENRGSGRRGKSSKFFDDKTAAAWERNVSEIFARLFESPLGSRSRRKISSTNSSERRTEKWSENFERTFVADLNRNVGRIFRAKFPPSTGPKSRAKISRDFFALDLDRKALEKFQAKFAAASREKSRRKISSKVPARAAREKSSKNSRRKPRRA